jgi:hypothetical protein
MTSFSLEEASTGDAKKRTRSPMPKADKREMGRCVSINSS